MTRKKNYNLVNIELVDGFSDFENVESFEKSGTWYKTIYSGKISGKKIYVNSNTNLAFVEEPANILENIVPEIESVNHRKTTQKEICSICKNILDEVHEFTIEGKHYDSDRVGPITDSSKIDEIFQKNEIIIVEGKIGEDKFTWSELKFTTAPFHYPSILDYIEGLD